MRPALSPRSMSLCKRICVFFELQPELKAKNLESVFLLLLLCLPVLHSSIIHIYSFTSTRPERLRAWVKSVQSRILFWSLLLSVFWLLSLTHTYLYIHTILLSNPPPHTHTHTLTVTPGSPPCLATVSFREPQFSKHWYKGGSNSILTVWGSSSWAWVSWLLTTWNKTDGTKVDVSGQSQVCFSDLNDRLNHNEGGLCVSHLASLVGSVLLEDVASSDHHPGCLDTVERSALLLLHQDLPNRTSELTIWSAVVIVLFNNFICFRD